MSPYRIDPNRARQAFRTYGNGDNDVEKLKLIYAFITQVEKDYEALDRLREMLGAATRCECHEREDD